MVHDIRQHFEEFPVSPIPSDARYAQDTCHVLVLLTAYDVRVWRAVVHKSKALKVRPVKDYGFRALRVHYVEPLAIFRPIVCHNALDGLGHNVREVPSSRFALPPGFTAQSLG